MIELYGDLKDFLETKGIDELIDKTNKSKSNQSIELIRNLVDKTDIEYNYLISFAWEIMEGYLENLYNFCFGGIPLHIYARKILGAKVNLDNVDTHSRPSINIRLNEEVKNYVKTKYPIYSSKTLHSK